jgi:hypothetical protein
VKESVDPTKSVASVGLQNESVEEGVNTPVDTTKSHPDNSPSPHHSPSGGADWEEKFSEQHGKSYYVNKKTRRKSWIAPSTDTSLDTTLVKKSASVGDSRIVTVSSSSHKAGSDTEWEEKYSEKHSKPYYFNKKTRRKSWIAPDPNCVDNASNLDSQARNSTFPQEKLFNQNMKEGSPLSNRQIFKNDPSVPDRPLTAKSVDALLVPDDNNMDFCVTPKDKDKEGELLSTQSKIGNEMQGNFDSDISRIEQLESPMSSPIRHADDVLLTELTVESIKRYTPVQLVTALNHYVKNSASLEHNLSLAEEKMSELSAQNEALVTDNTLLRQTVHDYSSQHQAREELIQGLQAQTSLLTQERDEVLHTLQQEHSLQANRDVQTLIEKEALLELKTLTSSQQEKISTLTSELEVTVSENEDLTARNTTLNNLCSEDSNRISALENKLTQALRENSGYQEKILQLQIKQSALIKKLEGTDVELRELKHMQGCAVEKNKALIVDNSKLVKKVTLLQKKGKSKCESTPVKKILSPSNRFSTEGIHIPVSMIQSSDSTRYQSTVAETGESLLDYSLSDINIMDVDKEERYKRRVELEAGWVFVDVDHIPLRKLIDGVENESEVGNIADEEVM